MREAAFEFYGVGVALEADRPEVLDSLRRDFEYFEAVPPRGGAEPIRLSLRGGPAPADFSKLGFPTLRTSAYSAYDRGPVRRIVYPEGAWAEYDYRRRRGSISTGATWGCEA